MVNALDQTGLAYFWQKIKSAFVAKDGSKGLSTNDYTTAEKQKLAGLENYELPTASASTKGGIKVGSGLSINSSGVLSATGGGSGGGGSSEPPMVEITYADLKDLRDNAGLTPGVQYRITDYTTIVTGYYDLSLLQAAGLLHYGTSAGHAFDVIVIADDESTLNENARAALHAGDTYFANNDLSSWELKYCIDNDATRFSFANASGKGVIYYMKDEFDNEAGYDFKNWLFVRYALALASASSVPTGMWDENFVPEDTGLVYDASTQPNRYASMYHVFMALQYYMSLNAYVSPFTRQNNNGGFILPNYDLACGMNILGAIQMASIDATYKAAFNADLYYTFDYFDASTGVHHDLSLGGITRLECHSNKLALELDMAGAQLFNTGEIIGVGGNVIEVNSVWMNTSQDGNPVDYLVGITKNEFGQYNFMNTLASQAYSNTFGNSCYSNTFGNSCYSNTFGNSCYSNTFGNSCDSNTFGNSCDSNTFGNSCYSNTFGNSCDSNTFGNSCDSNTFGNSCDSNTFGNSCYSNTFGNSCDSNTFGINNGNNEFESDLRYSEFTNDVRYLVIEQSAIYALKVTDPIDSVTVASEQLSSGSRCVEIQNYSMNPYYAAIIKRTDVNTFNIIKTTDGGETWVAA